ncbi:MAG: Gfo/Idh/MocA family oxidoreductase [Phycisphaerales bacterium]|nr:MAG: Gfo/Idh/MocA family oxidoreductase [Phycisphaerales bacterium]
MTERSGKMISRRTFVSGAAASVTAFTIVPQYVLGGSGNTPASDRINLAFIGTGGQGIVNLKRMLDFPEIRVVAVCDVNEVSDYSEFYFGGTAGREPARQIAEQSYAKRQASGTYKGVETYVDFRQMLQQREDIDAVLVATCDHVHAAASMAAMKLGKHVYCEKPLTNTVYESRKLGEAARAYKVATQMGNQGQASEGTRLMCEWIGDGAIGPVREVHAWTDRAGGRWPQGVERPQETPSVPKTLNWDMWLALAPYRAYHPIYLPFRWRGWCDFGTGALGDMGCHVLDPVFRALRLGHPASVRAESTAFNHDSYPVASTIHYEFPARGEMPPLKLTWYDGGRLPDRPEELEPGRRMPASGTLFVGETGKIVSDEYSGAPRIIPESKMKAYKIPPKTLPRSIGHHKEWVEACKGGKPAGSDFEFASLLTEVVLLGNVALKAGRKLSWDGASMKVTNDSEANNYLHRSYREGWTL